MAASERHGTPWSGKTRHGKDGGRGATWLGCVWDVLERLSGYGRPGIPGAVRLGAAGREGQRVTWQRRARHGGQRVESRGKETLGGSWFGL